MNKLLLFFVLFLLVGCTARTKSESSKPKILATTGMLYDAIINIAGDSVVADAIMGPGVDPHLYKATQGDLKKINEADLIIYNGIYLEGKMSKILEKVGRQKPVLAAAESINPSELLSLQAYESYDPHVWFDISKWKTVVRAISRRLMEQYPKNASFFNDNTLRYLRELDDLETYVKEQLSQIPEEKRLLITAHDAFEYFGKAYNMEVRGIQGISTVSDFGLKDVTEIIDLIVTRDIKAVFVETSVSNKSIQAVIEGCREKGHIVKIGGKLYSDAMGEYGTPEGTYIGMFRSNVNTIVEGLQ